MNVNMLSLRQRFLLMALGPLLLLGVMLFFFVRMEIVSLTEVSIDSGKNSLIDEKKTKIKEMMEMMVSQVEEQYQQGVSREAAIALFKKVKFGDNGYLFGYSGDAVRLFNGTSTSGIGDSYFDAKDSKGNYFIQQLLAASKKNGLAEGNHYVNYYFPKLGQSEALEKLSYAVFFPKWEMMVGVGIYIDEIQAVTDELHESFEHSQNQILTEIAAITVFMAFGLGILALILVKTITGPIARVNLSIKELAQGNGDLTRRLPTDIVPELADLSANVNHLLEWLNTMVKHIKTLASDIDEQSHAMIATADSIKNNSLSQHQETDQVASATTEMSSASADVASHATEAASAAHLANQNGLEAIRQMQNADSAMKELNSEVENANNVINHVGVEVSKITDVLQVIRSIADQTNLLALNAAIEAARAGEQGRGFAVVADEVRTLASRTQGSTGEIQQMIESLQSGAQEAINAISSSQKLASRTVERLNLAGQSLDMISSEIDKISSMNEQISTAAHEQSVVSEDISQRVVEIATMTDSTRDLSLENDKIADIIKRKAAELDELVASFKLH